jgi:hypothetical protein
VRRVVALAVVALLAPSLAVGQEAAPAAPPTCRPPLLSLAPAPGPFAPGTSTSLLFAIENTNEPPIEAVHATVTTTNPPGWSATPSQRDVTLGPQNVTIDALAITAPNRGSGQPQGNVTLLVTFVCPQPDVQLSASANATIPVQITQFQAPWPLMVGAFAILAVGVGVLAARRLRRGVGLLPLTPDRAIEPGKSAKFTFNVENRRSKPQRFRVEAAGVPEGWSLHLALEDLELEPGEEKTLWAILRAPPHAKPGEDVAVTLALVAPTARESIATRVRAKVVPPV